jgi:hypothetical protein
METSLIVLFILAGIAIFFEVFFGLLAEPFEKRKLRSNNSI